MKNSPVKPYKDPSKTKKQEVTEMFDNIAHHYDLLNHLLSVGIDNIWRRKAIRLLSKQKPQTILDIATGTGDLAVVASRLKPQKIVGLDISPNMIELATEKIARKGLSDIITMQVGDSENLPFTDNSFEAITVGFGVRNFGDLERGLSEMYRVLTPGGMVVILEFSKPRHFPIKQSFALFSKYVIPHVGRTISKDAKAYSYLPESVAAFPEGDAFIAILTKIGYTEARSKLLTDGVTTIYYATK